jgi:ABC-type Mn2+/Zn2+ transport system ATPase subunit
MTKAMTTIDLPDTEATQALGQRIAALLNPGDVVALTGGLGAGKTTLARAILAALGHEGEVPSPTFTIVETYDPPPRACRWSMPISTGSTIPPRPRRSGSTIIATTRADRRMARPRRGLLA